MIDNKNLIIPLLNFENKEDFYMLYIFKRKKDQPDSEKDNVQSVRTIKTYCIESVEYLEKRWDEIVTLCEYFKARAYIHVQKQNHKDVGLQMMVELATRLKDGASRQHNLFDSVVGQIKVYEKRWIIDIDTKDEEHLIKVITGIEDCQPIEFSKSSTVFKGIVYPTETLISKIIETIPTKNGYHLITKPFNSAEFRKLEFTEDIQKKNPTLLFYPDSLEK